MSSQLFSEIPELGIPTRPYVPRDARVKADEQAGLVSFQLFRNDDTDSSYEVLTNLKNIFQKQLPKMPKEYITRLVYDWRHESLVIIKQDPESLNNSNQIKTVLGGITFRAFPDKHFSEIVFCAVASAEQVKGFGSYLMCHLKELTKHLYPSIKHFLTYADNYAVGYFKKQGFTSNITLKKELWQGVIKDYDGGTLMQCTMMEGIDYLNWYQQIHELQLKLVKEIHARTGCGKVYPGLTHPMDPMDVPGVKESGWVPPSAEERAKHKPALTQLLRPLLAELIASPASWPFRNPVDPKDVPDYLSVIKQPMDLSTMDRKLAHGKYQNVAEFVQDFRLIVSNCKTYNDPETTYCKNATILEKIFEEKLKERNLV